MSRATTSVGPAAANGTMILTGRSGYPAPCASAAVAKRSPAQAASTRAITLVILMGAPWPCPALWRASTSLVLATARRWIGRGGARLQRGLLVTTVSHGSVPSPRGVSWRDYGSCDTNL